MATLLRALCALLFHWLGSIIHGTGRFRFLSPPSASFTDLRLALFPVSHISRSSGVSRSFGSIASASLRLCASPCLGLASPNQFSRPLRSRRKGAEGERAAGQTGRKLGAEKSPLRVRLVRLADARMTPTFSSISPTRRSVFGTQSTPLSDGYRGFKSLCLPRLSKS